MSTKKEKVTLFVYDLSHGMARSLGPMLVGRPVEGVWHTSVCVFGKRHIPIHPIGIDSVHHSTV